MEYENEGRVLLLDDERVVRYTIAACLKSANFEVRAVDTPEAALAELKSQPYDVVLSDIMMGAVDGFMFRDALRGFNPTIPVVFLTALMDSPENSLLEKIATDINSHYVPKNARRELLLGRLRQTVHAYRAEREVGELELRNERALKVAARVQHALLPPAVRCDGGIFYSVLWRPRHIVSGDLFSWFPLTPHSAMLVFGDIAGHGTPAALAMTAVMAHLKELQSSEGVVSARPECVCQAIDAFLRDTLRDVTYMAGTVLYFDFHEHCLRYVNAGGIEPVCIRRRDGKLVELNPEKRGGLPMGMMDGTVYTPDDVVEAKLPNDALIFLSSDGLDDLTSDKKGENRIPRDVFAEVVGELVRGAGGTSEIASVPYRLSQILKDMGYTHPHDDTSMFLVCDPQVSDTRFVAAVPMRAMDGIYDAIDRASKWAADFGYTDELTAKLELLLSEHLENVRKHGLDDESRRHEHVLVEMTPVREGLEVKVWDRGTPYEPNLSVVAPHPDVTLDEMNEILSSSGRGFAIIRKICRRVTREHFDGLNKYAFVMDA